MDLFLTCGSPRFQAERSAIANGRGSHAYLLEGPAGIGKCSFALAAACTFLCTGEQKPCFACAACRKVLDGLHPDVHTVKPEKNMLKVDQVRAVISTVYETPYEGGAKIYVIHDFHLANEQAQNALLKTLEEPPASDVFFLLAENSLQLLPTVCSRCRKIRLTGYGEAQILQQLERLFPQNGRNTYAARECGGNIGTAVGLVTDEELIRLHDLARELVTGIEGGYTVPRTAAVLEREKDSFLLLLQILQQKLFEKLQSTADILTLERIKALEEAAAAKKKNINSGLLIEELAYALVKGGVKWQR